MKVLVVGATGFMGRETVRQLAAAGWQVRALTRTPNQAADLHKMGADVLWGDLINPSSLAQACKGVYAVVDAAHSLVGSGKYSPSAVDLAGKHDLIHAAKTAGVEHFVFTSMLGVSRGSPVDFIQYKAITEEHLESSGMKYTILRPSAFMEWHAHIFLGKDILEKGKVSILGRGQVLTNFIAAADVARYAVLALTDERACNRILEIGGPDNITKNDLAQLYMRISGRQAKISHLPPVMLRVLSIVMKPFRPGVARVMHMAYVNEFNTQSFDPRKVLAEFPVSLTCLEDFVKARVAEWRG